MNKRLVNKDTEFKQLYEDYYPLVYNQLFSKIHSFEDAEDLCHEVFLLFYNKLEEIENHRAWLYSTIRFTVMNFIKKKEYQISKADIGNHEDDSSLIFVNGARDIRIILQEALEDQRNYENDKERILFELIAVNDYTYSEAARQLGFSIKQVRYRYEKVLKRIIRSLHKKGITNIEDIL